MHTLKADMSITWEMCTSAHRERSPTRVSKAVAPQVQGDEGAVEHEEIRHPPWPHPLRPHCTSPSLMSPPAEWPKAQD